MVAFFVAAAAAHMRLHIFKPACTAKTYRMVEGSVVEGTVRSEGATFHVPVAAPIRAIARSGECSSPSR
jgi:hypothetical protein